MKKKNRKHYEKRADALTFHVLWPFVERYAFKRKNRKMPQGLDINLELERVQVLKLFLALVGWYLKHVIISVQRVIPL